MKSWKQICCSFAGERRTMGVGQDRTSEACSAFLDGPDPWWDTAGNRQDQSTSAALAARHRMSRLQDGSQGR